MQIADFNLQASNESVEELLSYARKDCLGERDATIIAYVKLQDIKKIISHADIFKRIASKLDLEVIDPAR